MSRHNVVETRIERLIMIDTGRYNDQIRTPYKPQFRQDIEDQIYERVARVMNPHEATNNRTFVDIASDFLAPNLGEKRIANIENGWGERRKRWVMVLEHRTRHNQYYKQYITGYTRDNDIVSFKNTFDEQAAMYINNSILFSERIFTDDNGRARSVWTPKHNNQIISDREYKGAIHTHGAYSHIMRPYDVYQHVGIMDYMKEIKGRNARASTAVANTEAQSNRRSNNDPVRYLDNVLGRYHRNLVQSSAAGAGHDVLINKAHRTSTETSIADDPFLDWLRKLRNSVNNTTEFELGDLMSLDPDMPPIDYIKQESMLIDGGRERNNLRIDSEYADESMDWMGATPHAELGKMISNVMPGLLIDHALAGLGLLIDNDTMDGSWNYTPSNVDTWFETDTHMAVESVIGALIDTVLDPWILRRDAGVEMVLYCDVVGDMTMQLTIDGITERIVIPIFSDHQFPPILGGEIDDVEDVSSVFNKVLLAVYEDHADRNGVSGAKAEIDYTRGSSSTNKLVKPSF